MEPPAYLRLGVLSEDEERTRSRLLSVLSRARRANVRQESYYEGSRRVRDLGIAVPPNLRDVEAVAAWPEIVVDVMDERMEWRGWHTPDRDLGLDAVYRENHLAIEVGQAGLDALIFGVAYLTVGTGADGEPGVLVKASSPNRMTATWSPRLRRAVDALEESLDERGRLNGWVLYLPGETITVEFGGGRLRVVDRDEHGYSRVPVSVLLNRPRASRQSGRSEITRAVRSYTDSGMRTLLGMEVAREFYAAPQRWAMGADEEAFLDEDGNKVDAWTAMIGRILALPPSEVTGQAPAVGQFAQASPQPFTEIIKTYAQMVSAATGIPATHLGFATDNPASAEAIQRADMRLDKRALRRQASFDLGLVDLGELCALWRDGVAPPPGSVQSRWRPVTMVAPGAAADRAVKMIAAGALSPEWDFTLEQFGLTDEEIATVRRERVRSRGSAVLDALRAAPEVPLAQPVLDEGDAGA